MAKLLKKIINEKTLFCGKARKNLIYLIVDAKAPQYHTQALYLVIILS